MAVSVNSSASQVRSDFMVSDAAIPQRVSEQNDQMRKFEEMLSKADDKLRKFSDIKKAFDEGKFDVPTVDELKKAGVIADHTAAKETKSLAEKIVSGEVSAEDIPEDEITLKLLREITEMVEAQSENDKDVFLKLKELGFEEEIKLLSGKSVSDIEDNEKTESVDANILASLLSIDVSDEITGLLKKLAEDEADSAEEVVCVDAQDAEEESIIDHHIRIAGELSEKTSEENVSVPRDMFSQENESFADVRLTDEILQNSAEMNVGNETAERTDGVLNEAGADVFGQVSELDVNAETKVEADAGNAEVGEQTESEAISYEQNAAETYVQNSAETYVQDAAETLGQKADEQAQISAEAAEVLKNSAQNGEISKPEVNAKTDADGEKAEMLSAEEGSVSVKAADDRSKALGEELEMLKNAKQKPEAEQKPQEDVGKTSILQPNISESQMIFRKDNGELLVVSQKELTSQVMKLVEQVVSENKENTEYSIMLDPEDLGKITVKMTKAADGAVSVTIVAENARTQRLLEQNSDLMQSNLRNNGINLESWQTVNESQQNHPAQDYRGSAKNPYYAQENNTDEETDENGRSFADIIAAM